MSTHSNPEGTTARARQAWPAGATAGIALVAAACVGLAVALYWAVGPSDSIADDSAIDWEGLPSPPPDAR